MHHPGRLLRGDWRRSVHLTWWRPVIVSMPQQWRGCRVKGQRVVCFIFGRCCTGESDGGGGGGGGGGGNGGDATWRVMMATVAQPGVRSIEFYAGGVCRISDLKDSKFFCICCCSCASWLCIVASKLATLCDNSSTLSASSCAYVDVVSRQAIINYPIMELLVQLCCQQHGRESRQRIQCGRAGLS